MPERDRNALALAPIGICLILGALVISVFSISDTGDTPCGGLVSPNFGWSTNTQCGIAHLGTLAVVIALLIMGCAVLVISSLAATGVVSARWAVWSTLALTATGLIATAILAWRTSTRHEPVLKRGWRSVRDLTGAATIGLAVAAFFSAVVAFARDKSES